MNDGWLFDYATEAHTLSRRHDPITSHLAAEHIVETDKLGKMKKAAYDALTLNPGATASELDPAGIGSRIAKRLNDLRKDGLIRTHGEKTCSVTARLAQRWWPT